MIFAIIFFRFFDNIINSAFCLLVSFSNLVFNNFLQIFFAIAKSISSPPRFTLPPVLKTLNIPSLSLSNEISNVPPPKS